MTTLRLVGGTAKTAKAIPWPPASLADWARVERSALATIEDAAQRTPPLPLEVFPHAFVPAPLQGVYAAVGTELDNWTLTDRERTIALRYYWLGLIMATVTLHPPWWSALNKTVRKLSREEKQNARNDGPERRRRRSRTTGRPDWRPSPRRSADRRGA
jgi:hypothetical protein